MSLPILPSQAKPTSGPLPAITNANISLPYASGGGGGNLSTFVQTFFTTDNISGQGNINFVSSSVIQGYFDRGGAMTYDGVNQTSTSIVVGRDGGNWGNIISGDVWVAGASVTPGSERAAQLTTDAVGCLYLNAANVSTANLTVSSINGAQPGGGSSLFQSTFNAVPCPQNASTTLLAMPAGQFGYNGILTGTSASGFLSGFLNAANDNVGPNYWGQIIQAPQGQPPNALPCAMVINTGDSGLSTIKLIVANTSSQPATFTGVVSKLY